MGACVKDSFPTDNDTFADASEALKRLMSTLATKVRLAEGEVLMEQGDYGDAFYAIRAGSLEVSVLSSEGRKLSLDVMHAGDLFGEIALFDPGPRTATVIALEDCKLWSIKNADVLGAIRQSPDLAIDMLRLAGKRMRWMGLQLSEQVFLPLPARLARKVLHLTRHSDAAQPSLSLSQTELAEFAGASREAVSKTLARWKQEGVVAPTRGGLKVLDRDALHQLADANDF